MEPGASRRTGSDPDERGASPCAAPCDILSRAQLLVPTAVPPKKGVATSKVRLSRYLPVLPLKSIPVSAAEIRLFIAKPPLERTKRIPPSDPGPLLRHGNYVVVEHPGPYTINNGDAEAVHVGTAAARRQASPRPHDPVLED